MTVTLPTRLLESFCLGFVQVESNHLDLFVTGTDGRIYSTWWDANGGWANWFNVSGGAAALGAPIDVIARYPDHLDLFVTGTDGGIYSTWWD
jgi:hypothetical protein